MSEIAVPPVAQPVAPTLAQAPDPEALREILSGRGIVTEPYRPQLGDYLEHLATSGWQAVREFFRAIFGSFLDFGTLSGLFDAAGLALQIALVLLLAFALVLLVRYLRRRRHREKVALPAAKGSRAAVEASARDWRAELEARLAAGDARGSLEALWWWLAERLDQRQGGKAGEHPHPSWTTRELLSRRGRLDLRGPGRALDRLLYAEPDPQVAAVRGVWGELERALGPVPLEPA